MPYIKPKPTATASTYDNHNQIKTLNTSNQSPLQTGDWSLKEPTAKAERNQVMEHPTVEHQSSGKGVDTQNTVSRNVNETGVIIEKYMIEIKRYPDGKVYTNMFSIGVQRQVNKALQKPAKKVTQLNLKEKEIEELE